MLEGASMNNDELLIAIKDMFETKVTEIKNEVEQAKRHTGMLVEDLRKDVKAIAEGHSVLNEKMDRLEKDMTIVKEYIIGVDTKLNEHEVILKRVK